TVTHSACAPCLRQSPPLPPLSPLSLHDALPIYSLMLCVDLRQQLVQGGLGRQGRSATGQRQTGRQGQSAAFYESVHFAFLPLVVAGAGPVWFQCSTTAPRRQ